MSREEINIERRKCEQCGKVAEVDNNRKMYGMRVPFHGWIAVETQDGYGRSPADFCSKDCLHRYMCEAVGEEPDPEQMYYIWSFEHSAWWRSGENGYTEKLSEAGLYTGAKAKEICDRANECNREPQEGMVPQTKAQKGKTLMEIFAEEQANNASDKEVL